LPLGISGAISGSKEGLMKRLFDTILLAPAVALSFLGALGFRGAWRASAAVMEEFKQGEFAS